MPIRRFLRGRIPPEQLQRVGREVIRRYGEPADHGEPAVRVDCLDSDNWLSVPCVVEDRWFVKIITDQHVLVHGLLTAGRNIGAFSAGTEGFFEHFGTPVEMADHELAATRRMRELGVPAPAPIEAFEHDDLGVLVLEYLPSFRTLDELPADEIRGFAEDLFGSLATMHAAGLAHGDLREDNVLVAPGEDGTDRLYFIDATRVRPDAIDDATAYDIACALGSLEPHIGAGAAVEAARAHYGPSELLAARRFLDFVQMRPDHRFDGALVKGELEKVVS